MFLPDKVTILSPEKSELSPQLYGIYLESELLGVLFILGYFKALLWSRDRMLQRFPGFHVSSLCLFIQ